MNNTTLSDRLINNIGHAILESLNFDDDENDENIIQADTLSSAVFEQMNILKAYYNATGETTKPTGYKVSFDDISNTHVLSHNTESCRRDKYDDQLIDKLTYSGYIYCPQCPYPEIYWNNMDTAAYINKYDRQYNPYYKWVTSKNPSYVNVIIPDKEVIKAYEVSVDTWEIQMENIIKRYGKTAQTGFNILNNNIHYSELWISPDTGTMLTITSEKTLEREYDKIGRKKFMFTKLVIYNDL